MSTATVEPIPERVVRQTVYQDVIKRLHANQRALAQTSEFTPTQIDLAGSVVALLVMRRTLDRADAAAMTPRGLAAIASLIDREDENVEQLLAAGVIRQAQALLSRTPIVIPTQTRTALASATALV